MLPIMKTMVLKLSMLAATLVFILVYLIGLLTAANTLTHVGTDLTVHICALHYVTHGIQFVYVGCEFTHYLVSLIGLSTSSIML